jgi:hypothetical protein
MREPLVNPFLERMQALRPQRTRRAHDGNFEQAAGATRPHLGGTSAAHLNRERRLANMETIMKKLLLGASLAVLLASPALAQSFIPDFGTGNVAPMTQTWQRSAGAMATRGTQSFAQAPVSEQSGGAYRSPYQYGQYVGTDPDANIRFQLHRDLQDLD